MRDLLDTMDRLHGRIAAADPALAQQMQALVQQGANPGARAQEGFRTSVAYALQDLEKHHTGRLDLPSAGLRTEMTQRAETAPGLQNQAMQELMQATTSLDDRKLVGDIRRAAQEIAQHGNQSLPALQSHVDAIANKVRLAERLPDPALPAQSATPPQPAAPGSSPPVPPQPVVPPQPTAPGSFPPVPPQPVVQTQPGGRANTWQQPDGGANDSRQQNGSYVQVPVQASSLDTLLRAMRPSARDDQAPWEPPATPMADRFSALNQRTQIEGDDRTFMRAEQRGKAALDALQGFANGEAATVMGRVREAAKSAPGGMAEVMAGMREGGAFADLRKQFNNALADDAGATAAYDKAANSLAAYGRARTDVDAIIGRRPDAAAAVGRLEKLDAEIGQAASSTPSKTEGRTMMENLSKLAAELVQKAVDAVRSAFSRSPSATSSPSTSPSPGP